MSYEQTEDLKAFERRLTEVISRMQPITLRWRSFIVSFMGITSVSANVRTFLQPSRLTLIDLPFKFCVILVFISICAFAGTINWLMDPETFKVTFFQSLINHPFFTISCLALILLFCLGIHKRVVAPNIIASRCRQVLADYNMSCDDTGKLILKPRPST